MLIFIVMPPSTTKPNNDSGYGIDPLALAIIFIVAIALLGFIFNSIISEYGNLLQWFYSQAWRDIFTAIRVIIIVLDALLVIFVIITMRRILILQRKKPEEKAAIHVIPPKEVIREAWEGIQKLANSENPSDWNMAILRADALLDDILRDLGYEGETVADRLKIVDPNKLKSLEQIWSAHRLRNIIAHDPVTQHMKETTNYAIKSYELAFKELEMM